MVISATLKAIGKAASEAAKAAVKVAKEVASKVAKAIKTAVKTVTESVAKDEAKDTSKEASNSLGQGVDSAEMLKRQAANVAMTSQGIDEDDDKKKALQRGKLIRNSWFLSRLLPMNRVQELPLARAQRAAAVVLAPELLKKAGVNVSVKNDTINVIRPGKELGVKNDTLLTVPVTDITSKIGVSLPNKSIGAPLDGQKTEQSGSLLQQMRSAFKKGHQNDLTQTQEGGIQMPLPGEN